MPAPHLAITIAVVPALLWTAGAQAEAPLIDGVGAWNHSQVMRPRDGDAKDEAKPERADGQAEGQRRLMALSPESRQSLIALKPELDRRTQEDGAESANRWFESKVAEAERREGLRE